jgi:hypothetical protein
MGKQIPPERLVTAAVKLAELIAYDCSPEFRKTLNMRLSRQARLLAGRRAKVQFTFTYDPTAGLLKVASWGRAFVAVDLRALSPRLAH